jgi:hypothetical protein
MDQHRSQDENILRLMIRYPVLIPEVESRQAAGFFQNKTVRAVAEALMEAEHDPDGSLNASAVYDGLTEESQKDLFTRFLLEPLELEEPEVQMRDYLAALCKGGSETLRQDALNAALKQAESDGDVQRRNEILAEMKRLLVCKKRG